MALKERIEQEDIILYEILKNPVLATEFINNLDRGPNEEVFELTWYQKDMICDFNPYISLCCSRAVGKCLHKDSRILNTSTGEYKTVEDWFFSGNLDSLPSITEDWKQKKSKPIIEPNGKKDCIVITTTNGYKTSVTFEHPILTNTGFRKAEDLKIGDYIATPNALNYFGESPLTREEVVAAALFIAEGTYHKGSITTTDEEIIKEIKEVANFFGLSVRKDKISYFIKQEKNVGHGTGSGVAGVKNEYLDFLSNLGLRDKHSYEKFIPQQIFSLSKEKLGLFLNILFSCDGWCINSNVNTEVGYASSSEQLARDIKHLLLRFGITSSLGYKTNKKRGYWWISVKGYTNLVKFENEIGFVIGYKKEALRLCIEKAKDFQNQADIIPIPSFSRYKVIRKFSNRNDTTQPLKYFPSRIKAGRVVNKDKEFTKFEEADIFWVKVKNLYISKDQDTYSVEVDKYNTLVADDIYSHNTVSISSIIIWMLVFNVFPNDYIVYTVPNKVHLDPVFTNLVRMFRSNSLLKHFIEQRGGINGADFTIKLLNQAHLICRIAGQSGTGANVIGLHTPVVLADEMAYYSWPTWMELQPIVNTWTPGFRVMVSGVPTGVREKNVLYHCDMENSSYTKHRINSYMNPRITKEDEERAIEQYGGRESDDFQHNFLGLHGKPVFSIFDRSTFLIENYPIYKLSMNGIEIKDNLMEYKSKVSLLPGIPNVDEEVIFGIDLGYTEPTAIIVMSLDKYNRLKFHARVRLTKVAYHIQELVIDLLDSKYRPALIGIDKGNVGVSLTQSMMESQNWAHKDYSKRMIPVDFSGAITIGIDSDGKEIKSKTKPMSVSILQDYSNSHRIIYSHKDPEMISELERMTYTKNPSGDISYKTLTVKGGKQGEDHFTSALLCGVMAYYLNTEFLVTQPKKKKLMGSMWNF